MADSNLINQFTLISNNEVDGMEYGYNICPILAVITCMDTLRSRRASIGRRPLRLIMSNLAGRSVRVIFWHTQEAGFVNNVVGQIIAITGAFIRIDDGQFYQPGDSTFRLIEINIYKYESVVHLLGKASHQVVITNGRAVVERLPHSPTVTGGHLKDVQEMKGEEEEEEYSGKRGL